MGDRQPIDCKERQQLVLGGTYRVRTGPERLLAQGGMTTLGCQGSPGSAASQGTSHSWL